MIIRSLCLTVVALAAGDAGAAAVTARGALDAGDPPVVVGSPAGAERGPAAPPIRPLGDDRDSLQVSCIPVWPPAADATLWSGNPTANYGAIDLLWVGATYRSAVRWTLPALPARFMIADAHARLMLGSFTEPEPMAVTAHALTSAWTEAGVSWNSRDGSNPWATPGGDLLADPEAEVSVSDQPLPIAWSLTDLVAEWYNGRRVNHGILLRSEGYPSAFSKRFNARESAGYKPQLDVCHIVGPVDLGAYVPVAWGVPSPDWYQFIRGSFWNVVALRPSTADYDLALFADAGYSAFLASSVYAGNAVDYVVVDGNFAAGGFYFPRVNQYAGRGSYQLQQGHSSGDLVALAPQPEGHADGAAGSAPSATHGPYEMSPQQVARIWDAGLVNGVTYHFAVLPSAGDARLGMALHVSDPGQSATWYQPRASAVATSGPPGEPGAPLYMSHTATREGWHGLLVVSHGATTTTTYEVYMGVTPPWPRVFGDGFESLVAAALDEPCSGGSCK